MDKNTDLITHIIHHCGDIFSAQKRFGNEYESFQNDKDYFNSVSMSLLQIGELANHLTDEFINSHNNIPWSAIVGLRNRVVHGYGNLNIKLVWTMVVEDIPDLFEKCQAILLETANSN